ncbi:phage tail protein [Pseudooceanicola sp. C21-150M6]|uniref:phage tail protein n=1 Tax=Pseudooceanicola sp. C21-150M6 TaxID=3434355 RepID=UPI003D7F3A99
MNTAVNALLASSQRSQDIERELSAPTTAPGYRFVYGEARATGTPVGTPVRDDYIWGCWILNSRPSALPDFTLFFDKREVTLTGDAFDFDGTPDGGGTGGDFGGADADADPFDGYARVWISRGDQTSPPRQFLEEAPWASGDDEELWKDTDGWQGRTVIWCRLDRGPNRSRQERWPATPPLVEVEGKFSLVWDPRDGAQDADDPDTWEWSDNHALCTLDALRQNPIRQYRDANLHLDSFIDGADICEESVDLKSGGTEDRYTAAGTMLFSTGEIEDQINPLVASGAADLIRIGGQLGYAAGAYRAPSVTVTDFLEDGFEEQILAHETELVNVLRVSYLSPARGYETADLEPWEIPGALTEDGGVEAVRDLALSFCPSATQAMRVRKISGMRLRRQNRITCVLPPEAFDLVGGATVTLDIDHPEFDALNGIFEVESITPGIDPVGATGGVAMRLPATLVKHTSDIYDWDETTEEEEVVNEPYDGTREGVAPPGAITATTGDAANQDTGGYISPRVLYEFAPSPSSGVDLYEWQIRATTGGIWGELQGVIDAETINGSGDVFVYVPGVAGDAQDFRVLAVSASGKSEHVSITGVTPVVDIDLDIPTNGAAAETTPGTIEVSFRVPNDPDVRAIEIYAGPTSDPDDAALLSGPVYASQNATVTAEETGLGSAVTRYYFARSRGDYASASDFTAAVSETTA